MKRAKGILLIVAGGTTLSPIGFVLGFYVWFRLQHIMVGMEAEPRAYVLLAADLALAAWLYMRGVALCRSAASR